MSESVARKVQPFTIGTRLSVPAVQKCQEFAQSYHQNQSLDNHSLQRNLNSLYLSRSQVRARGPRPPSPVVRRASLGKPEEEDPAAEDHLNQNVASPSAVSRSIKKITISGNKEGLAEGPAEPAARGSASENNNNNNNVRRTPDPHLPRIVGVTCENKPSSQFKICLPEPQTTGGGLLEAAEAPAAAASWSDCFTRRNSLFRTEVLQAEAWIEGKLRGWQDGGDIQRRPLQDWEDTPRTLHADLRDFENTMVQLNQMGEQLICKLNPASDVVREQLSQLRAQWQTLKQMAADQTRTLDGATSLQDFNKKVEKLEVWIKEKEEEGSLVNVLKENVDKMQLTRRILDLKQDEQLHRNLHEEINHLALKLEKREKTDGKSISSKRKHINKMWLKVQSHLKNYQEDLQQALEVSSFYQQADNTLIAIDSMRKNLPAAKELDHVGDREMRETASQIMMLDVSVSQLSNLHPALAASITQKQREVKDGWSRLQKDVRSDRAALSPSSSTFTRETADPLTQAREPQYNVGTVPQRIMGKEVREEHHLKGCVSAVECGLGRQLLGNQSQPQQSANHTSSPVGVGAACAGDVIARLQQKAERKPRLAAAASLSHPQLHAQLQKFTVSADKTLSWLKDNVSIATQVCSIANCEGLEVARRCQYALEQEILNNKARIEVVKREGHELVRARHPGSAKIEEFLVQLGGLWEELRRRHRRNAVFLQASEELGVRVVKVLRALGGLEAWLESAELSAEEPAPAEGGSRPLEAEVAARLTDLRVLRQEVDGLHGHGHPHRQSLQARMGRLEQKYRSVQRSLTRHTSEARDAGAPTAFLERAELEGSQAERCPVQPPQNEASSTLLGSRSGGDEPLTKSVGSPAQNLGEESPSRSDRKKSHTQEHEEAVEELLSKHASLALRVDEGLCRGSELSLDILEKETDMAVRCEPDHCGLEVLREKQDHQEIAYESIREGIKEMEQQAARLEEIQADGARVVEGKVRGLLRGWTELGDTVIQNKLRLQEFVELQDFFRSYLAMISWTEDTRSCIFSDTALHLGKDGRKPLAAELDTQIEQKFKEFEELVATGKNLLDKDHHLTQMVRERMEELRSMLGWITVHWRAQKQQWLHKKSREESSQDNIYSTMCPVTEASAPDAEAYSSQQPLAPPPDEDQSSAAAGSWPPYPPSKAKPPEDGYEVMKCIGPQSCKTANPSVTVVREAGSPALGGTVNLILNLSSAGDSLVQVLDQPQAGEPAEEAEPEPVHRVSTYLHVKDNNLSVGPVYESITLPRQKSHASSPGSPAFFVSSTTSPPPSGPGPQAPNVTFHPAAGSGGGGSIFSSLKRMGKKRKRKRDARRHTIQKIMGVEEQAEGAPRSAGEAVAYDTHTWPLKEGGRRKGSAKGGGGVEAMAYMKNPLLTDIDKDCSGEYSITPYAVSEATTLSSTNQVRSHCRFLSLGSVLSFDLPKDMTLIPSIQDIITIAPPESKTVGGTDPDPLSQRHTALSSFKQARPAPAAAPLSGSPGAAAARDPPDASGRSPPAPSQPLDDGGELAVYRSDLSKTHSGPDGDAEEEWDKTSAGAKSRAGDRRQCCEQPIYVNQSAAEHKHKCPSVHTLIRDLNGHWYHRGARPRSGHECQSQASHVVVNLKSTVSVNVRQDSADSGISACSSLKLCPDAPEAPQQPKGVVGRLVSLEVNCAKKRDGLRASRASVDSAEPDADPVHLDRQQFEEEEEELEDIWNHTSNYRRSVCSDIMYQPGQGEPGPPDQAREPSPLSPSPQAPAVLYRNQSTASAPNLLVAEFKLPPHVQSLLGYDREHNSKGQQPPASLGERRSWAAFPHREPTSKAPVTANETASDPVKLPDVGDHQRYVYHYREEEEEEEEEEDREDAELAGVGEEVVERVNYSKEESISVLSVHMSLDGDCPRAAAGNPINLEKQEGPSATGGRPVALSGQPEPQSMEGTLERKQKLQPGGKKAASRGWNSYHAILYRHTLAFYEDRKDTLRNSAGGLPLNLIGAECSPAPDYTKRPNCFRLRLRDGSEYLLSAPSRFSMKKWIMKVQANAGHSEPASPGAPADQDYPASLRPSLCSACHGRAKCHCSHQADPGSTLPECKQAGSAHPKDLVVLNREFTHVPQGHLKRVDEQSAVSASDGGCCDDDDGDALNQRMSHRLFGPCNTSPSPDFPASSGLEWLGKKHRSHSFTSATFQKIKPASRASAGRGLERGSNYCVTLVVGDKSSDGPAGSRSSDPPLLASAGWQQDPCQESALRSYTSLPRPRNKSVFKKFFGKRDL